MKSDDRMAAREVSLAQANNDLTDDEAKAIAKRSLKISRMGEKRWGAIRAEADRLNAQALLDVFQTPQPAASPAPKAPARTPSQPNNAPSMGLMLSAELRESSTSYAQAAVLFCHCPHCGEAVRVNASVTKGGE